MDIDYKPTPFRSFPCFGAITLYVHASEVKYHIHFIHNSRMTVQILMVKISHKYCVIIVSNKTVLDICHHQDITATSVHTVIHNQIISMCFLKEFFVVCFIWDPPAQVRQVLVSEPPNYLHKPRHVNSWPCQCFLLQATMNPCVAHVCPVSFSHVFPRILTKVGHKYLLICICICLIQFWSICIYIWFD